MGLSGEEILKILERASELGFTQIKVEGLEASQEKITEKQIVEDMKSEDIVKPMSHFEDYTEEEILYFSTPYFDELQEKKQKGTEL